MIDNLPYTVCSDWYSELRRESFKASQELVAMYLARGMKLVPVGDTDVEYCYFDANELIPFRVVFKKYKTNLIMTVEWKAKEWKVYEETVSTIDE